MKTVTAWLFCGIWWIDALRVFGIAFLVFLVFGIPGWMWVSKVWWRRRDQRDVEELLLLLERIKAAKGTAEVKS